MTAASVEDSTQTIMEVIDREGAPPMKLTEWIELLESVISECRIRIVAAREDLRNKSDDEVSK